MLNNKNLPPTISLWQSLGPSFILLGLALGSGELLLWPYLVSQYGLGIIWGGLVGITFQYFLNTEVMRYSLAHGESVFVGWKRFLPFLPYWFILSSFIPWVLPGIVATSGAIIQHLVPILDYRLTTTFLLISMGLILSSGKTLYKTIETFQRTVLMIAIPLITYLVWRLATQADFTALFAGLVGKGDGYWLLPQGVAIGSFLGAFAYSGAGGNLNLAQSYYVKEKGFGMGKYMQKVSALFSGGIKPINLEGGLFRDTITNRKLWHKWWNLVTTEHALIFWGLGFITICLLALLSFATTQGQAEAGGLAFLFQEAEMIGISLHPAMRYVFLGASAVMLFGTQMGVFESTSRIISENVLLLNHREGKKANPSKAFYIALWSLIALGILYLQTGAHEPRTMVTIGALLNASAMLVSFPLILWLNLKTLPQYARPNLLRRFMLILASIFFAFFLSLSVFNVLAKGSI